MQAAMPLTVDITDIDAETIVAQHGPFVLLRTGAVATGVPTFDEWQSAVEWAQAVEKASPFWMGDLLAWGEHAFGEKYAQAIEATGLTAGHLMNVSSVSQKIPAERRHPELTFSHHQEVASLPPPKQDEWLDRAEVENWSVKDLRTHVRVAKAHEAGQTTELGLWVACADLDDQEALYAQMIASGRAARKTVKEI